VVIRLPEEDNITRKLVKGFKTGNLHSIIFAVMLLRKAVWISVILFQINNALFF
jgi:hypothetical protein